MEEEKYISQMAHEKDCARLERVIHRLWILCFIMFLTLAITNYMWWRYESQFEVVEEVTEQTVTQDVDANTKHSAVKEGLEKWVAWERSTKSLYERMYTELTGKGEVAARKIVEDLICDVSEELEAAEQYHLNKKAIDYDIVSIIEEQNAIHDKYGCKMRKK